MRHNISLTKENSIVLKDLCKSLGLRPSAVVAQALLTLKRQEAKVERELSVAKAGE